MESRRLLFRVILKVLFAIGLIVLIFVFVNSLFINTQSNNTDQASLIELSLEGMRRGDIRKARLGNKEVAVLYRKNPIVLKSSQLNETNKRSLSADYFVYFNQGDSGSCPLFYSNKTFKDICSGSTFDENGRDKKSPKHGFQLKVPPHFFDGARLYLGRWNNI